MRDALHPLFVIGSLAGGAVFALACLLLSPARAHDAPSGWAYPASCCSGFDCRQVPLADVREGGQGYVIVGTGEVIPYGDGRVKESPDGEFHWCSAAGAPDGKTICLFVPPRSF